MQQQEKSRATRGRRWLPVVFALVGVPLMVTAASTLALADTITLKNDHVIEGTIVQANRNTVFVRRNTGGVQPVIIAQIQEIRLETTGGDEVVGQLLVWVDGVYEIQTADALVRVRDREILEVEAPAAPVVAEDQPSTAPALPAPERPEVEDRRDEPVVEKITMAKAPTIVLAAGRELEGHIVEATRSVFTIRRATGGVNLTSRDSVDHIELTTTDGADLDGALVDWADGFYLVRLDGRVIMAHDEAIIGEFSDRSRQRDAETDATAEAADAAARPAPIPEAEDEPPQAADDTTPQQLARLGEEADGGPLRIEASADPVAEDGDEIVFLLTLSKAPERPLAIIYALTDDTAKAGRDFHPQEGVITLEPGNTSAEVRVRVIDDDIAEGEEQFQLFLGVDPKVAELSLEPVVATIRDND